MKRLLLTVLIVTGFLAFDTTAAPAQDVRTSNLTADCSKLVDLNGFVGGLPNGSTGQLKANGCYLVTAKVGLVGKSNVTLDGNGATIRKKPDPAGATKETTAYPCNKHTGHFQVSNALGITIKNLKLEGLNTHYAEFGDGNCHYAEHAVELLGGATNVRLENITAERIRGDGLYIQGANGVVAKNYKVLSNGRQGGAISRGSNVLLDGFTVGDSSRSGWDFECNDNETIVSNIEIRNFDFSSKLIAFPAQGYPCTMTDIHIHDGIVRRALSFVYDRQQRPSSPNCAGTRRNWKVENVQVSNVGSYGPASAVFCGTENVTFRNVRMPGGTLALEKSFGQLIVQNNCLKAEPKLISVLGSVVSSGNQIGTCSGIPPSSTTTTTKPPTSSTSTTTTTQPPVTTPPVDMVPVPREVLEAWQELLREVRRDGDRVHDEIESYL